MIETVAPFIADTTGCATALASASEPLRADAAGGLAAPPSDLLGGADDLQTSSKSSPPLGLGLGGGGWSTLWRELAAGSALVGDPVSWQQYSPRNQ